METKVLDVDTTALEVELIRIGAEKVFDGIRTITYFRNESDQGTPFLKLTEEGKLKLTSQRGEGGKEVKLFVSRKEECIELLGTMGYVPISEVQAKRTSYELGSIDIDIDEFPGIPAFAEIDMGDTPSFSVDGLMKELKIEDKEQVDITTPEVLERYGKNYFEVYRIS